MPSSRSNHIPTVLNVVKQLRPASILDIGTGFGKWGFLLREYTDIASSEHDHARYSKGNWRVQIDGIEGFEPYVTPVHRYVYDNIYVGDARALLPQLDRYDVILMCDVIEHLEKPEGTALLKECQRHANRAVIVSTPSKFVPQGPACGNDMEVHRSHWTGQHFHQLGTAVVKELENEILLAVLLVQDTQAPVLEPSKRGRARVAPLWRRVVTKGIRGVTNRFNYSGAR